MAQRVRSSQKNYRQYKTKNVGGNTIKETRLV